jgi:protein-tyrosine-phosphatase
MNEKRQQLLESCLTLDENAVVHAVQTNAVTQKINLSLTIKNLRSRLAKAETKAEVDAVIKLCNKNINGLKKYWARNTKSIAKPITKVKENTFNKGIAQLEQLIKDCEVKKKTLK